MAVTDKYMTTDEMAEIQGVCHRLDALSRSLSQYANISVDILSDEAGIGRTFPVYDHGGEVLGHIGLGDSGYVMYFDDDKPNN